MFKKNVLLYRLWTYWKQYPPYLTSAEDFRNNNNTEEEDKHFWQWFGFSVFFSWSAPFAFFFGAGGGVAGGRILEHLENIIQDGNSYQMLQEVGKPLLRCSAGVQPDLVDTHSSSGTSSARRSRRLPGNCCKFMDP